MFALVYHTKYSQQLSFKRVDTVTNMVLLAITGMPINHGAKIQTMNGVSLTTIGAMSILLVKVHSKLYILKGPRMQVS